VVDVSVIVVSYCTRELTRRCLESVPREMRGRPVEMVVLDNGSDDRSAEMVAADFPDATLVELSENIGFARGVNLAAGHARGRILVLLNPDAVLHEGALDELIRFLDGEPLVGAVGGRTLGPTGAVDLRSCGRLPTMWSTFCFGLGLSTLLKGNRFFDRQAIPEWHRDSPAEVGYVTGAFVAIPKSVWDEASGFDPRFFMYSEDVDLCRRIASDGHRVLFAPGATITHDFGASTAGRGERGELMLTGRATYLRKHWSRPAASAGLAGLWLGAGVRSGAARVVGTLTRLPGGSRGRYGETLARAADQSAAWSTIWSGRRRWLAGFPPASSTSR
jgi:N-acetylglucosaminyl-diphospho-decaprenol L-rhamnosyltransferase